MSVFTLPYPPSANRLWRYANGRVYLTKEAETFKTKSGWAMRRVGINQLAGPLSVRLRVYAPRVNGDLDNRIKISLDAMQGIAFENDSQIVELHAYRLIDRENPRIECEVTCMPEL